MPPAKLIKEFDLDLDDFNIKIQIFQGKYTPSSIWETRQEWINYVEKSKEYWEKMTVEQQDGVTHVIKHAMQRLHDKVDVWLPESVDMSSGAYIDVYFKILLTDAEEAIQKHSALTNMRLDEAKSESFDLLRELEAEKHTNN
jgi:hypothetical protein